MTQAMKPCPFCGGEGALHEYTAAAIENARRNGLIVPAMVECRRCGAMVSFDDGRYSTRERLTEAWNRRAGDEKKCISCAYCDIDEGMCYRDPNHTGRGMYTLLDTSCSWWEERR